MKIFYNNGDTIMKKQRLDQEKFYFCGLISPECVLSMYIVDVIVVRCEHLIEIIFLCTFCDSHNSIFLYQILSICVYFLLKRYLRSK